MKRVFDSASNIVEGAYDEAANAVEKIMGKTVPVVIDLFMSILGLGGIPRRVITAIKRFSSKVNTIIDMLLLKVVTVIKKMFGIKPAAGGAAAPSKGKDKGKAKANGKGRKGGKKSYKGKGGKKKKGDKGKGKKKKKKGDKGKPSAKEAKKLLGKAIAEAEKILERDNDEKSLKKDIRPLKKRYRLKRIQVLKVGESKYQIEAEINPRLRTRTRTLPPAYPTGQLVKSRTLDQLWDEVNPKSLLQNETSKQGSLRAKIAKKELLRRYSSRGNQMVHRARLILKYDYGQSPRPSKGAADEHAANSDSHIREKHCFDYSRGVAKNIADLSFRVLRGQNSRLQTYTPKPSVASAFMSISAADNAVVSFRNNELVPNWKSYRKQITTGSNAGWSSFLGEWSKKVVYPGSFSGKAVKRLVSGNYASPSNDHRMPYYFRSGYRKPLGASIIPTANGNQKLWNNDPNFNTSVMPLDTTNPNLTEEVSTAGALLRFSASHKAKGGWYINSAWPNS